MWGELEKVTEEDNDFLTKPFDEQEIKNVVFEMEHNKAASPDAIPMEFFQKCWDVVKGGILEMFRDFHQGKLDVSRINYGVITLLPKVNDAEKIQQYKPICLLNCLYKLITKVLTIMIEKVAEKLILHNQTAFMKGGNIMTGIMALHETLHETKRSGKTSIVLKLDFEKAHEKVCWDFLFDELKIRGFNEKWCLSIKQVVTRGTVCVKINNQMGPYL